MCVQNMIKFSAYLAFVKKINGNFLDPILQPFNNNNTEVMPTLEESLIEIPPLEPEEIETIETVEAENFVYGDERDSEEGRLWVGIGACKKKQPSIFLKI